MEFGFYQFDSGGGCLVNCSIASALWDFFFLGFDILNGAKRGRGFPSKKAAAAATRSFFYGVSGFPGEETCEAAGFYWPYWWRRRIKCGKPTVGAAETAGAATDTVSDGEPVAKADTPSAAADAVYDDATAFTASGATRSSFHTLSCVSPFFDYRWILFIIYFCKGWNFL